MMLVEFSGELDPAPAGALLPFEGQLDAPSDLIAFEGELDQDTQPGLAFTPSTSTPAGARSTAVVAGGDSDSGSAGGIGAELGNLRDQFFSGVDRTRAAVKSVGMGAQANQLLRAQDNLKALEDRGEGNTPEAFGLRKTIEHYAKRLPSMISDVTEAQADVERGLNMTTRDSVKAFNSAKTFKDAWSAFKAAPYDVVASVAAPSFATALPALITGLLFGSGPGAVVMGGASGITEAGSSLADYAREAGVNMTDPKAVQAFFTNRENLAAAMAYAGKRAGIIGSLDALSAGLASKTLAPAFASKLARQGVNVPAQMAAQGAVGAGGEAGAQLATRGRIDEPAQVLGEAFGELAGAPGEVVAFSAEARRAAISEPRPDPTRAILEAPTVDAAIRAAESAAEAPFAGAPISLPATPVAAAPSTSIADIPEANNVGRIDSAYGDDRGAGSSRGDLPSAWSRDRDVLSDSPESEVRGVAAGDAAPLELGEQLPRDSRGTAANQDVAALARRISELEARQDGTLPAPPKAESQTRGAPPNIASEVAAQRTSSAPVVTLNPSGTALIQGDSQSISAALRDAGITSFVRREDGAVLVGASQGQRAAEVIGALTKRPAPARSATANPEFLESTSAAPALRAVQPPPRAGAAAVERPLPGTDRGQAPSPAANVVAAAPIQAAPAQSLTSIARPEIGGPLTIHGKSKQLEAFLQENGITAVVPRKGGVVVGRSQADMALELVQGYGDVIPGGKSAVLMESDYTSSPAQRRADQAAVAPSAQPGRQEAEPGSNRDRGPNSGEPRQARGQDEVAPQRSELAWELRASGNLAIKGDPDTIRERLSALPTSALTRAPGGVVVAVSRSQEALALLDGLTAPTEADILAKQRRAANAEALDEREQIDREAAGQTLTAQDVPDQRNADSGDMFAREKAEAEIAKRNAGKAVDADPDQGDLLSAAPERAKPAAVEKIEDFGEKLEGARKDYAALMKDAQELDVAAVPLSKSWPEPDYVKLLASGADPYTVAFIHAARDEVPTKPQSAWKVKRWTASVTSLRDMATKLLSGEISKDKLTETLARDDFRHLRDALSGRVELYQRVGHEQSLKGIKISVGSYSVYRGQNFNPAKTMWTVEKAAKASAFSNWPNELAIGDTREQAIQAFVDKMKATPTTAEKKAPSFDLWRENGRIHLGKKIGREYITLYTFADVKEARAFRDANIDELTAALERYKTTPFERKSENAPRVGEDHRGGARMTPEVFDETFAFRGVQFGNYVENSRRQQDLNDGYDSLMDLAAVLGVPPKALSLNGKLGLAFGARGKGGIGAAAAHYEPDKVVINLTKNSGAGSLAHEWFHAVDNYFAKLDGGKGGNMTQGATNPAVRPEMQAAFLALRKAINTSGMFKRSLKLDARRSKAYWSTPHEMAARAFEAYAIAKLQDQNAANDYLANVVSEEFWTAQDALMGHENEKTYPYPTEAEMGPIREAFDKFFETVETKETETGTALYDIPKDDFSASPVLERLAYQGYEKAEVPRVQAARRLTNILTRYDNNKIGEGMFQLELKMLANQMTAASEAKQANRISSERERGADLVREKLIRARRQGELDNGTVEFGLWLLDQNPYLAEGLGASIRTAKEGSSAGRYNPASRVMTLFKDKANDGTAVHEILHHSERMMPEDVQKGITGEWAKAFAKAYKEATPEQREAMDKMAEGVAGGKSAHDAVIKAFKDKVLDYDKHYQLTNPSEFWAVNATRIMSGRFEAGSWIGKAKQWLSEMIEKAKGAFGLKSDAPIIAGLKAVLDGDGTFQSKNMLSKADTLSDRAADVTEPEPESPRQSPWSVWNTPEPTKLDRFIYETQDGRVDLKRAQEAIRDAGRDIEEKFDARLAETLYPGRIAYRSQQFLKAEVGPLLEALAVYKVKLDELSDYLLARHAPERNAHVAEVNPEMQDGGAGANSKGELMTNQAAKNYLALIPASRRLRLERVAAKVDAITAGTRRILVDEGLEKPEVVQAWELAYQFYVPLFKDEAETGKPHPIGTGFNVKGPASKRSTGSSKKVVDVLAHVLMQREAAITRAEKNRVGLSLYGLVLTNPNPEFWSALRPSMSDGEIAAELSAMGVPPEAREGMALAPTIRTVGADNQVAERPNPMYRNMRGAITLKVAGEDRVVMLNVDNERAARLADSLKNLDGLTTLDLANSFVGHTTRWLASVNTRFNVAFGFVNVIRDVQAGILNLTNTPLQNRKGKVFGNVPAAVVGIAREIRGDSKRTEWSDLFQQFQEDGGQTGYREMFGDAGERSKAIEKELASLESAGKLTPGKVAHAVLDLLSDFSDVLENAVRLSAYKAALDDGMSRPAAARLARELTVDFNRKGRTTRELSPLFAFLNASVQGTSRVVETLRGPAGAKIIAGGLGLGMLQAVMLAAAGFDDKDIPEWVKARNLIIPTGWRSKEKRYIAIPMGLVYNALPNTGRVLAELALYGTKDVGARLAEAVGEIAGAINPLGGGNMLTPDGALRTIAPTVLDPLIELGFNKNFAGNQIERRPFNEEGDNRPGYERARERTLRTVTGQVYLGVSKAVNTLTGGTKYEAGAASPTPERLRYLAQTVGGGALRELEKAVNSSVDAAAGQPVRATAIPLAGRFVGEVDQNAAEQSKYFESKRQIERIQSSLKAAEKAGDGVEYRKILRAHPEVLAHSELQATQKSIRELNKLAVETIGNPGQMKKIDAQRAEEMRTLNRLLKRMEKSEPTLADWLKGDEGPKP